MSNSVSGQFIPPRSVDRPALRAELDGALSRPVTLLVAQAGSGKSVLLSQWVASHPELRCAWVDLDETDNDPDHFADHLVSSLVAADIDLDPDEMRSADSRGGSAVAHDPLRTLARQLADVGEISIILEDLHRLGNETIVRRLSAFAELLPENAHLIISSRLDSPTLWSRNRLRSEVGEIRQPAFAMGLDEAEALVVPIVGRAIDRSGIALLVERTEGWAAGLQLAATALRERKDTARFIAEFRGSDRLVAGYLTEEVLETLAPEERSALLAIASLDRLSVDLICAVDPQPSSRDLLGQLERRSLFVSPLDDSREWFRLHPLFRDLLRFRARTEDPEAEPRALRRAAKWHLQRGEMGPAIEYFLRVHDWDQAIDAILMCNLDLFQQIDTAATARHLNSVPESALSDRIDVQLLRAILAATIGGTTIAEDRMRAILASPHITPAQTAYTQTFLASLVHWRARPDVTIEFAERALATIDSFGDPPARDHFPDPVILRTIAMMSLGRAYFLTGNLALARRWLEDTLATDGAGYSVLRIGALGSLALVHAWCGRTRLAADAAAEARALAHEMGNQSHPATAEAYLATALIAIESADLARAEADLHTGASLAYADGREWLSWVAFMELLALDDLRVEDRVRTHPAGTPPPIVADFLLARRSRTLRLHGSPDDSRRLLRRSPSVTTAVMFEKIAAELTLGNVPSARSQLQQFAALPDAAGPLGRVRGLILASWWASENGNGTRADAFLQDAMRLAQDNDLVTVLADAGPLSLRRVTDVNAELVTATLEAAAPRTPPLGVEMRIADEPPVHLTDRELELLALLPTRLTNVELAHRFFVSVNTIKTHAAHIYGKLGVSNRNGAIVRATQLGLLTPYSKNSSSFVYRDY